MMPWSSALIEGSSGDCSKRPLSHVFMASRYRPPVWGRPLESAKVSCRLN
jgi:hypothetical protein